MSGESLYYLKILAAFGVFIGIGLYQLRSVERLRKEDELKKQQQLREAEKQLRQQKDSKDDQAD